MPKRVKFLGWNTENPERPRLAYEIEGEDKPMFIPAEMLRTPMGAEAAAAQVGGYTPTDPGPESQYTTGDTFVGYQPAGSAPVYRNNYTNQVRVAPGGADEMRASREYGGRNSRLTYGPPSPVQTEAYGTVPSPSDGRIKGVPAIAADMQSRVAELDSERGPATQTDMANRLYRDNSYLSPGRQAYMQAQARDQGAVPDQFDVDIGDATVKPAEPDYAMALNRLRAQLGLR